ncbi:MAG: hypothetical protein A2Z34_06940 [Planctomycetes bacterium RBG_16_59_8]|nr:MAG: hypothetical protein A2Z34_06940 [Planctomycetes bacterium RBG_16_59_8]
MEAMENDRLVRYYRSLGRRYRWLVFRETFLEAAFYLSTVAAIVLVGDRTAALLRSDVPLIPVPAALFWLGGAVLVLCMTTATARALLPPLPERLLAKSVDSALDSEEAFMTSMELARGGHDNPFTSLLLENLAPRLTAVKRSAILPSPPVGYRWGILLAIVAIVAATLTLPESPGGAEGMSGRPANEPPPRRAADPWNIPDLSPPVPAPAVVIRPGLAPSEEILGKPHARPPVKLHPEAVDPLIGPGRFVEKERMVYTEGNDGKGETTPYRKVFHNYQKAAEALIAREEIPPAARDLVRAYFDAIKPPD